MIENTAKPEIKAELLVSATKRNWAVMIAAVALMFIIAAGLVFTYLYERHVYAVNNATSSSSSASVSSSTSSTSSSVSTQSDASSELVSDLQSVDASLQTVSSSNVDMNSSFSDQATDLNP